MSNNPKSIFKCLIASELCNPGSYSQNIIDSLPIYYDPQLLLALIVS